MDDKKDKNNKSSSEKENPIEQLRKQLENLMGDKNVKFEFAPNFMPEPPQDDFEEEREVPDWVEEDDYEC